MSGEVEYGDVICHVNWGIPRLGFAYQKVIALLALFSRLWLLCENSRPSFVREPAAMTPRGALGPWLCVATFQWFCLCREAEKITPTRLSAPVYRLPPKGV